MADGFFAAESFAGFLPAIGISISFWPGAVFFDFLGAFFGVAGAAAAESMVAELHPLIDKVWRHCDDKGPRGRTVTLKMKFNGFEIITRSRSVPVPVRSRDDLERLSIGLLRHEMPVTRPVRLLGVSLSSLQGSEQDEPQLGLPI